VVASVWVASGSGRGSASPSGAPITVSDVNAPQGWTPLDIGVARIWTPPDWSEASGPGICTIDRIVITTALAHSGATAWQGPLLVAQLTSRPTIGSASGR